MAEKPDEVDVGDIKLLEYKQVSKGMLKLGEDNLSLLGKVTWKLYVFSMGNKILRKEKEKIFGETIIQFFPVERQKLVERKGKKNILMKDLTKPLFYITYDSRQCPKLIEKSGEEIPKELFYMILCR